MNTPSAFTSDCERHAKASWQAVAKTWQSFTEWEKARRARSTGKKMEAGCLGLLIFWIPFILPLLLYTLYLGVVALVAVYASLVSAVWGASVEVDRLRYRLGKGAK